MAPSSRLPRRQQQTGSSPDPILLELPTASSENAVTKLPTSTAMSTLGNKRKASREPEDEESLPRAKRAALPPIDEDGSGPRVAQPQPLRPNPSANNGVRPGARAPSALGKPRSVSGSGPARTTRATSAPPKPPGTRPPSRNAPPTRAPVARTASGSQPRPTGDRQLKELQTQVRSIESAQAANSARLAADMDQERTKVAQLQENHQTLSRELAAARTFELTQRRELVNANDEMDALKKRHARELMELEMDLKKCEREKREMKEDNRLLRDDLERARTTVSSLKGTIAQQETSQLTLKVRNDALQNQIGALQSSFDYSAETVSKLKLDLETSQKRVQELEEEVREAEMIRRKLHNTIQELKGNIRVFARVRPVLPSDLNDFRASSSARSLVASGSWDDVDLKAQAMAQIAFPDARDHREIVLSSSSESATGQERKETWNFAFDRVFEPQSTQEDVFEEISQLAQSCTDGYNVCIFAYGQTGSGKSFTMEGGSTAANVGMIPRAVEQVFRVTEDLKAKGWTYTHEGQFLEIYNETINDLLGHGDFDKKKHEVKHDKGRTFVTDVVVKPLHSPAQVKALLSLANSRRSVAATLMNERSSRSHSVFTLRIKGTNAHTGESCEGCLNLVDLAGSERLDASGAGSNKERLRETQAINKSLSALGDVIAALGEKSEKGDKHIPYRNSKLTYLLQNSLSGNSKTLMVLNLSPLAVHLNESLCSLRFATKVNNTTIGTAKKLKSA